jgi:hypothetical protein
MNTRELLVIVEDRGLRIEVREGQPILVRPQGKGEVTDELLAVLKHHRQRIIEILSSPQPQE